MNSRRLIFHHVPKTAGTYVLNELAKSTGGRPVRIPQTSRRTGLRHATGLLNSSHHAFQNVRPEDGDFFFTWLRDPVAMAFSAFSYFKARPQFAGAAVVSPNPLFAVQVRRIQEFDSVEDYVDAALADSFPIFPAGHFTLDWSRFHFVGFTETMAESLAGLRDAAGLRTVRPDWEPVNRSPRLPRYREAEVRESLLSLECGIYNDQARERMPDLFQPRPARKDSPVEMVRPKVGGLPPARPEDVFLVVTVHPPYLHFLEDLLPTWNKLLPSTVRRFLVLDGCDQDQVDALPPAVREWELIRGTFGDCALARNTVLERTDLPRWILYWDADNMPRADFFPTLLEAAGKASEQTGILHSTVRGPGGKILLGEDPRRTCFIDTASFWRVAALLHVGGWRPSLQLCDWELANRVAAAGWQVEKTEALLEWNEHGENLTFHNSFEKAVFNCRAFGLVVPFRGRKDLLDRWVKSVLAMELPPKLGLTVIDDSGRPAFRKQLDQALKKVRDRFRRITVLDRPEDFLPRTDSFESIHHRVGRMYSAAIAATPEAFILTWEDDVTPKDPAAFWKLSRGFQPSPYRLAAVAGIVPDRGNEWKAIAASDPSRWRGAVRIEDVKGRMVKTGMVAGGFTLWSRAALERNPILGQETMEDGFPLGWDGFVCSRLHLDGWEVRLHGGVLCDHYR